MRIEFFKGRRWLATVSMATALAVTGFYGLRAAALGTLPFEHPDTDHQNGRALRGGRRARLFGGGEARRAGGGQHFIVESSEANGDGNRRRASIPSSASFSAMTSGSVSTYRSSEPRKLLDRASSSAPKATF